MAPSTLSQLATALDGVLLRPADGGYPAAARRPTIGGFDEILPQAVVGCASVRDVRTAVGFAAAHDLPLAIRGGGHSFADFCSTDGLLLDLSRMDRITGGAQAVTVGPGVRIKALADHLAGLGRLVPVGWCPTVGVIGAVLGGGYSPLGRYYGLGCDHLRSAEVVLANGDQVRVDATTEPDLFWALRGAGGGNFAVVTAATLQTRPAPTATVFAQSWDYRHAGAVVECWQRFAPYADATVNAELVLAAGADPSTVPMAVLFGVVVGSAEHTIDLLREFAGQVGAAPGRLRTVATLDGAELARHHMYAGMPAELVPAPAPPPGQRPVRRVLRSGFFDAPLPAAVVEELVGHFVADRQPGEYREIEFVPWGGAYRQAPPSGAAFAHRDPLFLVEVNANVSGTATDAARRRVEQSVGQCWSLLRPSASGQVYPNYPQADLPDWAVAYHGRNLARLSAVKAAYDPTGLFRFPQSVPLPAAQDPTC